MLFDLLIINAKEVVVISNFNNPLTFKQMDNPSIIYKGAIAIKDTKISKVGTTKQLSKIKADVVIDAKNRVVTPGFVDPHTHLVFAGSRHEEFEMRCRGKSYIEIAKAGGGILSTVKKVRRANQEQLLTLAKERLTRMLFCGTTTVEIKSGYGLDVENELKMLRVINKLNEFGIVNVVPTFLGAHAIPPDYSSNDYTKLVSDKMLPEIARQRLAKFCDVFCDKSAFNLKQSRLILNCAKKYGISPKIHADEFRYDGGVRVAYEVGAVSADHLNFVNVKYLSSIAKKSCKFVAVLLPCTSLFLGLKKYAPAREIISLGIPVALGSDFNPGSCMTYNMQIVMTVACCQMKMTPAESLTALTINAACAIGMQDKVGSITPGKIADILIWDLPSYRAIPYEFGTGIITTIIKSGKPIWHQP